MWVRLNWRIWIATISISYNIFSYFIFFKNSSCGNWEPLFLSYCFFSWFLDNFLTWWLLFKVRGSIHLWSNLCLFFLRWTHFSIHTSVILFIKSRLIFVIHIISRSNTYILQLYLSLPMLMRNVMAVSFTHIIQINLFITLHPDFWIASLTWTLLQTLFKLTIWISARLFRFLSLISLRILLAASSDTLAHN